MIAVPVLGQEIIQVLVPCSVYGPPLLATIPKICGLTWPPFQPVQGSAMKYPTYDFGVIRSFGNLTVPEETVEEWKVRPYPRDLGP